MLHFVAHAALRARTKKYAIEGPLVQALNIRRAAVEHVLSRTSEDEPVERARLLDCLPVQWVDPDLAHRTIAAAHGERARIDVTRAFLDSLRHHETDAGAYRTAISPHVESNSPVAAELIADAYLSLDPGPRQRQSMRNYLAEHRDGLDPVWMLRLGVRFSVESLDEIAMNFIRGAVANGLDSQQTPVAALVLWIGGDRCGAKVIAETFELDQTGWFTQAARSLQSFIRATAVGPQQALQILATNESEGLVRHPATVGALVARLAFLRMKALVQLERWDEAVREAYAVVATHGYRDYDLHVQGLCSEFDVRLTDRLAVTPDEILQSRLLIAAHRELDPTPWLLIEGQLVRSVQGACTNH